MTRRLVPLALAALVVLVVLAGATPAQSATRSGGHHWKRHVRQAQRFARQREGTVSFAAVDERGRIHAKHGLRRFDSASVIKVMLMVAYLNEPDVRDRRLRDADHDLLRPMITRSDNATAQRVYEKVGNAGLNRLARRADMRRFTPNAVWGLSQITARDQAWFMYRIKRFIPDRHVGYALGLLRHIVPSQRWGIPRVAPRHWIVNFKGGFVPDGSTGLWKINQVALLHRAPRRRLAVAVLTRGNPTAAYGHHTVRGVAKRLLRHYNRDTN